MDYKCVFEEYFEYQHLMGEFNMRTNINTGWLQNHPAMSTDEQGYSAIVPLVDYAQTAFLLPDEIEDYLEPQIENAMLHLHLIALHNNADTTQLFNNNRSCLFLLVVAAADTTPTTAHGAKNQYLTIEDYINSAISGDGRRGFKFLTPMTSWHSTIQTAYSSTTVKYIVTETIDFKVNLGQIFKILQAAYSESQVEADLAKVYLCIYTETGHVDSLSPVADSNRFSIEVNWKFKNSQTSNQRGLTLGTKSLSSNGGRAKPQRNAHDAQIYGNLLNLSNMLRKGKR